MTRLTADPGNLYLRREWLNKEGYHSNATVFAEVSKSDYLPVFKIADCYHAVSLWLEYDPASQDSMDNALYKMDLLIEVAKETREAMKQAMEFHKEHPLPAVPRPRRRRALVAPRRE